MGFTEIRSEVSAQVIIPDGKDVQPRRIDYRRFTTLSDARMHAEGATRAYLSVGTGAKQSKHCWPVHDVIKTASRSRVFSAVVHGDPMLGTCSVLVESLHFRPL